MKKLMFILVVAMVAAPVMADITFTAPPGPTLTIFYESDSGDVVRGIALDVTISDAGETSNADVTFVAEDYNCFIDHAWDMEKEGGPGGYDVGEGDGPLANADEAGSLQGSSDVFAISMGVLDEDGYQAGAEPGASPEPLLTATISGPPGVYTVIIKGDTTRGPDSGVVGSVIPSNLSGGLEITTTVTITDCYQGQPDYDEYLLAGSPECWCWPRQCRGDADGDKQGSDFFGWKWVDTDDLNILITAWLVKDDPKGPGITPAQACADFSHSRQGSDFFGWKRVDTDDLNILINHWLVKEDPKGPGVPPDCEPGNVVPPGDL